MAWPIGMWRVPSNIRGCLLVAGHERQHPWDVTEGRVGRQQQHSRRGRLGERVQRTAAEGPVCDLGQDGLACAGHDALEVYEGHGAVRTERSESRPGRSAWSGRFATGPAGTRDGVGYRLDPVIAVELTRMREAPAAGRRLRLARAAGGALRGSRGRAAPHSPVTPYAPGGGPMTLMPYCAAVLERGWTAGSLLSGSCVRSGTLSPAWR
jgi:hypothetical protein